MWILLEVGNLNKFKKFFNEPYEYGFLFVLDDRIANFLQLDPLNV